MDIINKIERMLIGEEKNAYQKFFEKKLKEYGVSSIAKLSDEDKKKFFAEVKKEWK